VVAKGKAQKFRGSTAKNGDSCCAKNVQRNMSLGNFGKKSFTLSYL
jgi:hypothetical protein